MSTTPPEPPPRSSEPPPAPEFDIPNAEKYMLEADVMRRRQLRSALLHGSTRTWREHRRVWPGVVAGLVTVGLIIAIIAVKSAYDKDRENQQAEELQAYCDDISRDLETTLDDLDVNDSDEVESAEESARSLADNVPSHMVDEIQETADTIADQLDAMVEAETDSDRLDRLNQAPAYEKAKLDLAAFNDKYCTG
jgi:HPt (histidine-containing phosphotransfer) domain-containing protein